MKTALEALESSRVFVTTREKIKHPEGTKWYDEAITALRTAIDQSEKQEPVAYKWNGELFMLNEINMLGVTDAVPLYTSPPAAPRQWVGLTDEEVHEGFCHVEYETPNDWNTDPDDWCQQFARYLEAKLKEKNT